MDDFSIRQQAFLLRKKTNEKIPLIKTGFRIGRERQYADFHIVDNSTISRCHAQIDNLNGVYTIRDCNSVNHTYVNGQKIAPNRPYTLYSGDEIRLGSEVFDFVLIPATPPFSAPRQETPDPLYDILYNGLDRMLPRISCPASSVEVINRTLHKILLEKPQLCHFEGNWKWEDAVVPEYTLTAEHRRQLNTQVASVLAHIHPVDNSPRDQVDTVYHFLATSVRYDRLAPNSQNAYGALVEHRALCKGIAKAFQLLLTQLNIPCRLVEGTLDGQTKHVWNQYCIDNIWYHADVTMAYPQFSSIAVRGAGSYVALFPQQILLTHTIWDPEAKPVEQKPTFFQSLCNQRRQPRRNLEQIPHLLQPQLLGAPQFLGGGSVSDVYRFGSVVLKRIACGEDPVQLYHAMREVSMLQKLTDCFQVAQLRAWDTIREPDGYTVYLVLEYAQPLEEYCSRVTLAPIEAVAMVRNVCGALLQCYNSGVAHLDVQPGNLLMSPNGIIKLTDFSSAVPTVEAQRLADLRGTPAYMAPEVYRSRTYSQAADVYSLGILLYCLLNHGQLPHGDLYPPHEAVQKRMDGLPVKPIFQSPELCALVEKACQFDPSLRYRDLQIFAMALDHLLCVLREPHKSIFTVPGTSFAPTQPVFQPTRPPIHEEARSAPPVSQPFRPGAPVPQQPGPIPSASPMPAAAPKSASRGGLFSAFRKSSPKSQPAPPAPRPAPAPSWTLPVPRFQADTFGESTVLSGPVYQPATPTVSGSSLWNAPSIQADTFGATVLPSPPQKQPAPAPVRVDKVQFSAVAPQTALKGEYILVQLFMYEQEFRSAVDEALQMAESPMQEKKTGFYQVKDNTRVKVVLSSPDAEVLDDTAEEIWNGGYLCFDFALDIPQDTPKRQILLKAAVYFDDIPATRLMMTLRLQTQHEQRMDVLRCDVLTAFVSYASQDRARVGGLIQGMKKARPDMDIFFDVNSLRSGDDWEQVLRREVERRDILFLCWSQHAKASPWVEMEWRYALQNKGIECIEPIPIDPPDVCPPPQELQSKHFNDSLLYIINRP